MTKQSATELQTTIDRLSLELEQLQPATLEQMHTRALLGESSTKMVAANAKIADQRAIIEIDLAVAHTQIASALQAAAQPRCSALLAARADWIADAQNALFDALQAERLLATALAAYTTAAQAAEQAGNDANQVARQAGLAEQCPRPELGQEIGNQLRQSLPELVQPFAGPQLYRQMIEAKHHA
jgi:hypothetical protein